MDVSGFIALTNHQVGRRICVGRHVANNSIFIDIVSLLWGTSIEPLKDEAGRPLLPDVNASINNGLTVVPVPFKCSITPRFAEAEVVVAQTVELYA